MKHDPYTTTARFASTCKESGKRINKGDSILIWPARTGKSSVYLIGAAPKAEQSFREFQVLSYEEDNGYCCY